MVMNLIFLSYFLSLNYFLGNLVYPVNSCPPPNKQIAFLYKSVWGIITLTFIIILLGIVGLLNEKIILIVIHSLFIISIFKYFYGKKIDFHKIRLIKKRLLNNPYIFIYASILLIIFIFQFILSSTPPYARDALVYHLTIPKIYLKSHRIAEIPGNIYSNFPLNIEMLYLFGLSFSNPIFPKIINFSFNLLLSLLIIMIIRRYASITYGIIGAIVWNLIPSAFFVATIAYVDLEVTFFIVLISFSILLFAETGHRMYVIQSALFMGYLLGIKYTALIYFLAAIIFLYIFHIRANKGIKSVLKTLLFFVLISSLIGGFWYIKNICCVGNPIYPFLYTIFGGKGWDETRARILQLFLRHYGSNKPLGTTKDFFDYLFLPLRLSFFSEFFDGHIGPLFLLLLPSLLFCLKGCKFLWPLKVFVYFSLCLYIGWMCSSMQVRFLLPALCLLVVIIVISLFFLKNKYLKLLFHFLLILSLIFNSAFLIKKYGQINPFSYLINKNKDQFLEKQVPYYRTYKKVNNLLSPNDYLFLVFMKNYGFYLNMPFYSDTLFEEYTIVELLKNSINELNAFLRKNSFTHLLINKNLFLKLYSYLSEKEINEVLNLRNRFKLFKIGYLQSIYEDKDAVLYAYKRQ